MPLMVNLAEQWTVYQHVREELDNSKNMPASKDYGSECRIAEDRSASGRFPRGSRSIANCGTSCGRPLMSGFDSDTCTRSPRLQKHRNTEESKAAPLLYVLVGGPGASIKVSSIYMLIMARSILG